MILTNGVATYVSSLPEEIEEREVSNSNVETTLGGSRKEQADSVRLSIDLRMLMTRTEYIIFKSIIDEFNLPLDYTPDRLLAGQAAIVPIRVVLRERPSMDQYVGYAGEISYFVDIKFEEVIF